MLNPNNDRLDYGQILAPPAEYILDFAVGTTYSLDLDALVGACLALGLSTETDSDMMNNPVCLLEALRRTGDNIALFCEGGQIHLPNTVNSLYILLEKMVFPVTTAKTNGITSYPSFHPKFWLIRYTSNKDVRYRVVVLSRNLTFDRSWDVTFYMDGQLTNKRTDKNEPICDFLRYLLSRLPDSDNAKNKADSIQSMINDLAHLEFEPAEKTFSDFEFIPNGVMKREGGFYRFDETPLFKDTFREIAVISPFISSGIIRNFNDRNDKSPIENPRYMLITREMSLANLKPEDVTNFKIYTLRDKVIDGETALSDDSQPAKKQDIHAKMYMIRKYSDTDLYLGSLNASHNAVYGNVEFMIRLRSKNRYLNIDSLTEALFGKDEDGPDNPFQEVTLKNAIIDEDTEKDNDLDAIIKQINRSKPFAQVEPTEDLYSVNVHFGECEIGDYKVEVRPLLSRKTEIFSRDVHFSGLEIAMLSEFYVVSVTDDTRTVERVLVIPTKGLPDNREKEIVARVVNDQACFYRYIAFLLGDDKIISMMESNVMNGGTYNTSVHSTTHLPALYEKMLQTAATAPEKFKGIEYLIKTISEDGIIPDDFKQLYEMFRKAVKADG